MHAHTSQSGFSLLELMLVLVIFLIVTGSVFLLLDTAQKRYRAEQQVLDALQSGRIGIEQLTREIHSAGYPPAGTYDSNSPSWGAGGVPVSRIAIPFVGMTGGVMDQSCQVNGGAPPCTIPGPYDLVLETDLDPENGAEQVEWIYYQVARPTPGSPTCTLYRAVSPKAAGGIPTAAAGTPLVEQIINRNDGTCGLNPADPANQPVFQYVCDGGAFTCNPQDIIEVLIQLQARAPQPEILQGTIRVRAVTLRSVARRLNPPQ